MAKGLKFRPEGVIPATLLAFDEALAIDEATTRAHLRDVASVRGVSAIAVNGHASEVHACSFDEQRLLMRLAAEEIGGSLPIVCGVYADGSHEAARIAKMAESEGASALLVFPSHVWGMGGDEKPEMALAHFTEIAAATDLPLIAFVYPQSSGVMLRFDTLLRLFEAVPSIRAIKDWCNDPLLHARHIRTFQSLTRPVSVLTTHSSWLMASLAMGCNGLLSGAGSVVAGMQVAMFDALRADDLKAARAVNEAYQILAHALYEAPFTDMHNRMKECLVLLGKLDRAFVRPPLAKLRTAEITALEKALLAVGLLEGQRCQRPT